MNTVIWADLQVWQRIWVDVLESAQVIRPNIIFVQKFIIEIKKKKKKTISAQVILLVISIRRPVKLTLQHSVVRKVCSNWLHGCRYKKKKPLRRGCVLTRSVIRRAGEHRMPDRTHSNWPPSSEPLTLKQCDGYSKYRSATALFEWTQSGLTTYWIMYIHTSVNLTRCQCQSRCNWYHFNWLILLCRDLLTTLLPSSTWNRFADKDN